MTPVAGMMHATCLDSVIICCACGQQQGVMTIIMQFSTVAVVLTSGAC